LRVSIGRDKGVGEYYFLSTENLIPYKKQTRRNFNETEIDQLADTIKEYGIKNPLLVVPSTDEKEKFEVVSGERRLRAAKKIGLKKVPCIIIDAVKAEEVALIENIQRADLHPIEIGNALKSLLSKSDWGDITKLSGKIGKSQPTISNYLSYSKLPEEIKTYLIQHNIKERSTLRNVLKQDTLEGMKDVLGLGNKTKTPLSKSVLRLHIEDGSLKMQDKAVFKLSRVDRLKIKEQLLDLIARLDGFDLNEKN
jgi:ParB family chromosome partitioning protein